MYSAKLGSGVVHLEGDNPKTGTVPVVSKRSLNGRILQGRQAKVVTLYGSKRLTVTSLNTNTPAPQGGRIKLSFAPNLNLEGVTLTPLTLSNLTSKGAFLTFINVDGTSSRQDLETTAPGGSLVVPLNAKGLRAVDIFALNAYAVDDVAFTDEAVD